MQHHAAWAFIIVDMMGENTDYADVLEVGSAGIGGRWSEVFTR